MGEEHAVEVLTTGSILLRLGIVILLVLANGFFVAAEFALVGARKTRIDAMAEKGNRRAKLARDAISHLDRYISGTQLGITLASLGLGWVGERTLSALLIQLFIGLPDPWNVIATHLVAGTIAFAFITFLHIVLGELAPKSLALLRPEETSLWTAGPLIAFSRIVAPFIFVLNGTANLVLRAFGLRAATEAERVHRPEEIEMLLRQSYEHGMLAEEPVEMIRGVFDLSETSAAEVMTPRTDVVALPLTATVDEAADMMLSEGHLRLPVFDGTLDHIVGVVVARDVWRAQREGQTALEPFVRSISFIPDSKPVEDLLREMQAKRVHMAIVVDEFGGTEGLVTLEDLLEEIVGEIADEHEVELPEIEEREGGQAVVSGGLPVSELNYHYDLRLPEEEFNTVAGYIMGILGRIAEEGDEIVFPGGKLSVIEMDGRRIARVLFTPMELVSEDGAAEEG